MASQIYQGRRGVITRIDFLKRKIKEKEKELESLHIELEECIGVNQFQERKYDAKFAANSGR